MFEDIVTKIVELQKRIASLETREQRKFGDIANQNYSYFESDGTLVMSGNATVFEDLRVPVTSTKLAGTNDPGFAKFLDDGAGSTGVFVYWFDKATAEQLFFACQLPHSYDEATNITPHVHWVPKANGGAGTKVSWGLEYTWANMGATYGNTTIIYANAHSPVETLVASRHYRTDFAAITGTAKEISSMLVCRIFRDATGAGATDDYDDDAGLLEVDFHYASDTIGSRTISTK